MKKHILIALTLFAFLAMPVFAGMSPRYSPAHVAIMAVGDLAGTPAIVGVKETATAKSSNTKTELATHIEKAKTGIGVVNTVGLVGLNRCIAHSHRLPLFEIGWRISA